MTAAPAVPFPGSRSLLGWWRELAAHRPQRLWFASLPLSRLEARVELTSVRPLDHLHQLMLDHLAGREEPLPFPPTWKGGLLRELADAGLVRQADNSWVCTDAGRSARERGAVVRSWRERRVFHFVEGQPPRYLPLLRPAALPRPAPDGWKLDPAVLDVCLRQPEGWKRRHQFPVEVQGLVTPAPGGEPDWREVILVGPEQLHLALVRMPSEQPGPALLGFGVRPDGWVLDASEPLLALGEGWRDELPGLAEEPTAEEWKRAWQAWCQPRSLPNGEVDGCQVEPAGHRLVVRAPVRLVERLRAARSDALKGEAWLLAGTGRCRTAAEIDLQSNE